LKIVIVDTTIHSELIGGAQTFLPLLIKGLHNKGNEVHLIAQGNPNIKVEKQIHESGAIVHTSIWSKNDLPENSAKFFSKWVNELKPDVYVISVSWEVGWLSLPYLSTSIATFAIAHSNNNGFYLPAGHYKNFLTGVAGVSHEICNKYETVSCIDKARINWIPYGIRSSGDVSQRSDDSPLKLIFVGRLEEIDKRISDVAAIIKKLSSTTLSYQFHIIGDGSRMAHLKNELDKEIESRKVIFTGWLSSDEVLGLLQQSDIFILTSSSEGFSISLIEAMANGCCPVVTDIPSGSIQLIKHGVNGYLLPVGDTQAFAEKIAVLAEQRYILNDMRTGAWEKGKQYTINKMISTYMTMFEKGIAVNKTDKRSPDPAFPLMASCRSRYPRWLRILKNKLSI
jgi:glycosyltransferase involved in cell wall biosynthesis